MSREHQSARKDAQAFDKRKLEQPVVGKRYGKVIVVAETEAPEWIFGRANRARRWLEILCDCGTRKKVAAVTLAVGRARSCGCTMKAHRRELALRNQPVMRKARTP